ncbi:MAG: YggS family pyridoxal phosphate-dependent enzyme [Kiritimatiellae bacterium]|nr:YggS family pyridoxal phosphate-dependent enzyme [Kiritimatiellia bacterium]
MAESDGQEDSFRERLAHIRARMAAACARAKRGADEVELIAVTKTFGPEAVRDAWQAGIAQLGENRVQEAAAKIPTCVSGPEWHLIGHLQRNKVRPALELFTVLQAVDSERLLEQIARVADETGARPRVLLEINVSGEASKFGLTPEAAPAAIEHTLTLPSLTLEGLMTMAPFCPDQELTRPVFARLRDCRDRWERQFGIGLPRLSMGMSNDYEVAIEEGATWVRIGTALFGGRPRWQPARSSEDIEERTWVVE